MAMIATLVIGGNLPARADATLAGAGIATVSWNNVPYCSFPFSFQLASSGSNFAFQTEAGPGQETFNNGDPFALLNCLNSPYYFTVTDSNQEPQQTVCVPIGNPITDAYSFAPSKLTAKGSTQIISSTWNFCGDLVPETNTITPTSSSSISYTDIVRYTYGSLKVTATLTRIA
ncbi:MAG: hypothetical protein ACYDCC_05320 [Actinomycetota bacterium]